MSTLPRLSQILDVPTSFTPLKPSDILQCLYVNGFIYCTIVQMVCYCAIVQVLRFGALFVARAAV